MTKLKEYLDKNGIRITWFAEQIGIHRNALAEAVYGRRPIPAKYWKKIVILTENQVKLEDLVNEAYPDETTN